MTRALLRPLHVVLLSLLLAPSPAVAALALVSAVVDDSVGNDNGVIDRNECVRLLVRVRNDGPVSSTAISGTLSTTTPGVTILQPTSIWGDLEPGRADVSATPFRFSTSAAFSCGTTVQLSLALTTAEGSGSLSIPLSTPAPSTASFSASGHVPIPDNNATGANLTIPVSGVSGALSKVTVAVHLTHTFDGDLRFEILAPDGTAVLLSNRRGGSGWSFGTDCPANWNDTGFDDAAGTSITSIQGWDAPFAGTYSPEQPLAGLAGKSGSAVNGSWKLHASDLASGDIGFIECASVTLTSGCSPAGGTCGPRLPETSDDGARPLRLVKSGAFVDLRFEDVDGANVNLYVSAAATHPFRVTAPESGARRCAIPGVTSLGGGWNGVSGFDPATGITGPTDLLYLLVSTDSGPATEGRLGTDSEGSAISADSTCN